MSLNIIFILGFVLIAWRMIHGYKKGMIEEIVSLISLIVAVVIVFLFGVAVTGYLDKEMNHMILAIIFILVIGFVFKLLSFLFMSLKIISELPIIKVVNKIAGILVGACEGILFIWIGFLVLNYFEVGTISEYVTSSALSNPFMKVLYENNILEQLIQMFITKNAYFGQLVSGRLL